MAYPQEVFYETTLHSNSLIHQRREATYINTLLYQLEVLKKTGRYDAFKLQWHPSYDDPPNVWPIPNHLFWDSDVAKWIEGACYFLHQHPHSKIDFAIQELVGMIRSAQQPDGYLNIHYTVVEPGKRFTNLRDFHELYNCGHLIEAALAHNDLYKNDLLLEPMIKYVDLLYKTFGPGPDQKHGYPGHPEIELALLRLHQRTKDPKHLALARYFITERGNPNGVKGRLFYEVEAEERGDDPNHKPSYHGEQGSLWYYQADKPIVDQQTIEGHSVRAMYLFAAVADLVQYDGKSHDPKLLEAIQRLWTNMVDRKMYVTGGIGAMRKWEGFGPDYFLPQSFDEGGCYSETCAAIGVMMFAERLLQIQLDGKFADIMELCLYNAVLTAMSFDGTKFTYDNILASCDEDLSKRSDWFTCACCPPNMLRILGQIGGYIWNHTVTETGAAIVNTHLFIPSTLKFSSGNDIIELDQQSNWPWAGDVKFTLKTTSTNVSMNIRIPGWAEDWSISPSLPNVQPQNGYLALPAEWLAANPSFTLHIPTTIRQISPHPYTNQPTVTLARGPIIYCVEDTDNKWVQDHFKSIVLSPFLSGDQVSEELITDPTTSDRYVRIVVHNGGAAQLNTDSLKPMPAMPMKGLSQAYRDAKLLDKLIFIPYYFRSNRGGNGQMRVGIKKWDK